MSAVPIGIVRFPGTNCDQDVFDAVAGIDGARPVWLWHKETELGGVRGIVLAGGFAYGDYLRAGAIARFSPIMERVIAFARSGGPVLGICNGFQILTEAGLLPGALMRNAGLSFVCRDQWLQVDGVAGQDRAIALLDDAREHWVQLVIARPTVRVKTPETV